MSDEPQAPAENGVDVTTITLPTKARLADAEAMMDEFRKAATAGSVEIDASAVEEVTTPFVLTLVSFLHTRPEALPKAAVLNAPAAFVDAFSDLGLFQDLMKMEFRS